MPTPNKDAYISFKVTSEEKKEIQEDVKHENLDSVSALLRMIWRKWRATEKWVVSTPRKEENHETQ